MRFLRMRSVVAFALLVPFAAPQAAWSWGNTGHEAVACVAWSRLPQATKDKITALLKQVPTRTSADGKLTIPGYKEWSAGLPAGLSQDEQQMYIFMRAATYPDSLKRKFLYDSDTPPADPAKGTANLGFQDTASHGYWHFVDQAFGSAAAAGSQPPTVPQSCWVKKSGKPVNPPVPQKVLPATPTPNAATEIVLLTAALASGETDALKAYDLMWLEHLVGDIHQPLHAVVRFVGGIGDAGGNCVAIAVPTTLRAPFAGGKPPVELHAFWDDLPGIGDPMATDKAAAYAKALAAADATEAAVADPNSWAAESMQMAEKDVYAAPIADGLGAPKPYLITKAYEDQAVADAAARIALAGARLANLLEKALQ